MSSESTIDESLPPIAEITPEVCKVPIQASSLDKVPNLRAVIRTRNSNITDQGLPERYIATIFQAASKSYSACREVDECIMNHFLKDLNFSFS